MQGFIGYHDTKALPFRDGDMVTIPAGVLVRTMNPSKEPYRTTRKQTRKIDHILCGQSEAVWLVKRSRYPQYSELFALYDLAMDMAHEQDCPTKRRKLIDFANKLAIPHSNPDVRWAGSGGYWCWVDINDVLGVEARFEPTLDHLMAIVEG